MRDEKDAELINWRGASLRMHDGRCVNDDKVLGCQSSQGGSGDLEEMIVASAFCAPVLDVCHLSIFTCISGICWTPKPL